MAIGGKAVAGGDAFLLQIEYDSTDFGFIF
jgi:hypothetical protein